MEMWLKKEPPRSGDGAGQRPPPCSDDPACGCWHPPNPSELYGLLCRRHFPWNLILLTVFVSDLGVAGERCQVRMEGGEKEERLQVPVRSLGRQGYFHPISSCKDVSTLSFQMGLVSPPPTPASIVSLLVNLFLRGLHRAS